MDTATDRSRAWRYGTALAALLALAAPALAADPSPALISVEGEASAEVVPDIAHLSLGVEAERPTAAAATADVAAAAQGMVEQLKADGVADTDVTTTALALGAVYPDDGPRSPGQPRPPRMFRAATTFNIVVKPADRAGLIAAHLVDKGANAIEGIDYESSAAAERLDQLRAEAMHDAQRKAQVYVGALGLHLGRVVEITPTGQQPFLQRAMRPAAMAAKSVIPTAPGTLTLQASVTVRWEIMP